MKKILKGILLLMAALVMRETKAQTALRFYYYPKNNVYYSFSEKQYIYVDQGDWKKVDKLPDEIILSSKEKVTMYSMKPEIWQMNADHVDRYRRMSLPRIKLPKNLNDRKALREIYDTYSPFTPAIG